MRHRWLWPMVLTLGLAGCGATPVLLHPAIKVGAFDQREIGYAVGGRAVMVDARGAVGGVAGLALADAVAQAMAEAALPVDTRPTARPDPSARPDYRVVWDFAPAPTDLAHAVCAAPRSPPPPPPPPRAAGPGLRVHIAFCRGESPLSSVFAEAGPHPVGTPGFVALVGHAARELLSPDITQAPDVSRRPVMFRRPHHF